MDTDNHIYELRIYAIAPGRILDMERRFQNDISTLFPRHGVRIVGSWSAFSGPQNPTFVYLMRWSSFEERTSAFSKFAQDPDWQEVRRRTNGPSELVEHYEINLLRALDSSRIAEPMPLNDGGVYELAIQPAANGRPVEMRQTFLSFELPAQVRQGAEVVGAFEAISGTKLPKLVSLVRWPDAKMQAAAQPAIDMDPDLAKRRGEEIQREGRCILGHADRYLMRGLPIAWAKA